MSRGAPLVEVSQSVPLHGVHRLHRTTGDAAEEDRSRRIHGHDYLVEATALLPVDTATGFAIDQALLRRAVEAAIEPLIGIEMEAPLGGQATAEAITVFVWDRLADPRIGLPGLAAVAVSRPVHGDRTVFRGRFLPVEEPRP